MSTGSKTYRATLGGGLAESEVIQKHALAMIPIEKQQAEAALEISQKKFEVEYEQAKKMNLLADQLSGTDQPVYVTQAAEQAAAPKNYLMYAGLGLLAFLLLRKGKI